MTIETKYAIDDAIYTASAYGIDRQIIKAIKITGKRGTVEYGFKAHGSLLLWQGMGDGYIWFKENELYVTDTAATKAYEKLQALKEAAQAKEKEQELIRRKARLRAELEQLEAGIDPDDLDEDD